jgi:hypothetical protein
VFVIQNIIFLDHLNTLGDSDQLDYLVKAGLLVDFPRASGAGVLNTFEDFRRYLARAVRVEFSIRRQIPLLWRRKRIQNKLPMPPENLAAVLSILQRLLDKVASRATDG